jgi:hypothetical protein
MNRKEAIRQTHQLDTLRSLGFTNDEADKLRRISMTLQRWHELECGVDGGCVERDPESGFTYWRSEYTGKLSRVPDRETGAHKRLGDIVHARNIRQPHAEDPLLSYYVQTDPRGAALYIIRPQDVPEGKDVAAYYSRGICVY